MSPGTGASGVPHPRAQEPAEGDLARSGIAISSEACQFGSNPVAPIFIRNEPFGENVEGLFCLKWYFSAFAVTLIYLDL